MESFKDNKDRTWQVEITTSTLKRVTSLCKVDLLTIVEKDSGLIEKLCSDPILLVDVIYAVCQPQAETNGITDIEFGEGMAGDVIGDATNALLDALVSFFRSPIREKLKDVVEAARRVEKRAFELMEQRIDRELGQLEEEELAKFAASFGSTPESSESTPPS